MHRHRTNAVNHTTHKASYIYIKYNHSNESRTRCVREILAPNCSKATTGSVGSAARMDGKPSDAPDVQSRTIQDHEGTDVNLVWTTWRNNEQSEERPPPFPFQVYFISGAEAIANDLDFATALVRRLDSERERERYSRTQVNIRDEMKPRFDFYTKVFSNILALSPWPSSHSSEASYEARILVIDGAECLQNGIILVASNPTRYRKGAHNSQWQQAKDFHIVETLRGPSTTPTAGRHCIRLLLTEWWSHRIQHGLPRWNNDVAQAGVLNSDLDDDPSGVGSNDALQVSGTASSSAANVQADPEDGPNDLYPRIPDRFDATELYLKDEELPHLRARTYADFLGLPSTSVWDSRLSKFRPAFSFTLYVSHDSPPLRAKAFFTCLNKGLLSMAQWTLDVVTNMPSLEAAFEYHSTGTKQRTSERLARFRACTRLILNKIAADRVPTELVDYIEDVAVPPAIPSYYSRTVRPHRNLFLYLDDDHLSSGPLMVFSEQIHHHPVDKALEPSLRGPADWHSELVQERPVRVRSPRFWHRVADELHTLWSFCSPRLFVPSTELPVVFISVDWPDFSLPYHTTTSHAGWSNSIRAEFSLYLQHTEPITIHGQPIFSHDIFNEALELVDVETGEILPSSRCLQFESPGRADSWSHARELGFPRQWSPETEAQMSTLEPGQWHRYQGFCAEDICEWLEVMEDAGVLQDGKTYTLRLRDDVVIPRWTYGTVAERKGPYDLPALHPRTTGEVQFDFEHRPTEPWYNVPTMKIECRRRETPATGPSGSGQAGYARRVWSTEFEYYHR